MQELLQRHLGALHPGVGGTEDQRRHGSRLDHAQRFVGLGCVALADQSRHVDVGMGTSGRKISPSRRKQPAAIAPRRPVASSTARHLATGQHQVLAGVHRAGVQRPRAGPVLTSRRRPGYRGRSSRARAGRMSGHRIRRSSSCQPRRSAGGSARTSAAGRDPRRSGVAIENEVKPSPPWPEAGEVGRVGDEDRDVHRPRHPGDRVDVACE